MTGPTIESLEKLSGTPRDGPLLRYSLGLAYQKRGGQGDRVRAIECLRDALRRDPLYSAAWKALGKALLEASDMQGALAAYRQGIEAARQRGDKQAEKEMSVFVRRLEK